MAQNLVALGLWRKALVAGVRQAGPDLSARQLALLLTVYLTDPPHTVRGLAATLNVSKPAITRALDRLSILGFVRRKRDAEDKRNVLVQRTVKGSVFLSDFAQIVIDAGAVAPEDLAAVVATQGNGAGDGHAVSAAQEIASESASENTPSVTDSAAADAPVAAGVA